MDNTTRLAIIKLIHTIIWLFFNAVLAYLLYAVTINKIDKWIWIGLGLFLIEGIILVIFRMNCPLTLIARRYSSSSKENFDIYLPNWLAKYNKPIYTLILIVIIVMVCYRLLF